MSEEQKATDLPQVSDISSSHDADLDSEESSDEEIILDEPSDTEDFVPMQKDNEEETDDESCSSGEEENGVCVQSNEICGVKFSKLIFGKTDEVKKEQQDLDLEEEDDDGDKENETEDSETVPSKDSKATVLGSPFKKYRSKSILDDDMENYKSDEDDFFDPLSCGETLSDIEYKDGDERDTESEPETEEIGKHKKTGKPLLSIKMIQELKIPPTEESCGKAEATVVPLDSSMECS